MIHSLKNRNIHTSLLNYVKKWNELKIKKKRNDSYLSHHLLHRSLKSTGKSSQKMTKKEKFKFKKVELYWLKLLSNQMFQSVMERVKKEQVSLRDCQPFSDQVK